MSRLLTSLFVLLFCSVNLAFAQSDTESFLVRVLGDIDVTPPTTPTLLTIDAITYSQIDITWSSSTDNTIVSGYVVSRDGIPIATTSLLSYSDTGLSGSTTYSYFVRAFDPSFNYSSSSNTLATTTPAAPVPPAATSTEPSQGTIARTIVDELVIETGVSTTSLFVTTAMPARIELRWGKTTDYELGYLVNDIFRRDHVIDLTDLEPGTRYQFELIGYTPSGRQSVIEAGSFTTLSKKVPVPPPNVSYFEALQNGVDVDLSWVLPAIDNLAHVRVVRSHFGFPAHPHDGALVYQGSGSGAVDGDILRHYSPVFYTVFVYDDDGNISSGAVAMVYAEFAEGIGGGIVEDDPVLIGDVIPVAGPTSTVDTERLTPSMLVPDLYDITIRQGSETNHFSENSINLHTNIDFTISIPATAVSKHLKSIIVTLRDPSNHKKQYSFLLRINNNGSAYEAVIPAFKIAGQTRIVLEIYDFEAFVVASYQNTLNFTDQVIEPKNGEVLFPDMFVQQPLFWLWLVLVLLLMIFFILFLARRRDDDDEDNE